MAATVTSSPRSKSQRVASIVAALQAKGEQLTDEELQEMQSKTAALVAAETHIEIHSDGTHIEIHSAD